MRIRVGGHQFATVKEVDFTGAVGEVNDNEALEISPATSGPAPLTVERISGDITLTGDQAGTWVDVDSGGNANARPLDLVIPAEVGQTVGVQAFYNCPTAAGGFYMDFAVYVDGSRVRGVGDPTTGTIPLWVWNSLAVDVSTYLTVEVQEGDVENGAIRLRLQRKWTSQAGSRTIKATNSAPKPIRLVGHGPFV